MIENIIPKTDLNRWIWKLCFLYIIVLNFITPLYKFSEIYFGFPKINLSVLRFLIMALSLVLLLLQNKKDYYLSMTLSNLKYPIISILIAVLIVSVSYIYVTDYGLESEEVFLRRVDICIVGYIMMFLSGFYFDYVNEKKYMFYFLFMWLFYSLFILINYKILLASFFIYEERPELNLNYIFLSDSYLFLSIFMLTLLKKKNSILLVWLVTLGVLFLMPSRANTLSFIFASLIVFVSLKKIILLICSLPFLLLITNGFDEYKLENNIIFENSRLLNTDLKNDTSLETRNSIFDKNYENLMDNWFFGDFMGDYRTYKEDGYYIHNLFSRWEQFGIIHFIFFILTFFLLIKKLFYLRGNNDFIYKSTFYLTLFTIPLLFFVRSFDQTLIWFLVSRIVVYFYRIKKANNNFNICQTDI